MSADIDIEWKASPADLGCSEAESRSADWMPSLMPMLVVQNAYSLSEDSFVPLAHGWNYELRHATGR
eukprot:1531276-Prymnesium_polylepis.1